MLIIFTSVNSHKALVSIVVMATLKYKNEYVYANVIHLHAQDG